jgi:hypothetical protein
MNAKSPSTQSAGPPRWVPIVGAVVAVAGLAWAVASHFIPSVKSVAVPPPGTQQKAEATGGTAINAAGSATVKVDREVPPTTGSPTASLPVTAGSQHAEAGSGGTAVNATDSAEVAVKKSY